MLVNIKNVPFLQFEGVMEDLEALRGLNVEQRSAAECLDGPVLIVAGAGSGKTRVLTSRIALLLEKGVPSDSIMALTFTKKAAGEMKERIASMVGERRSSRLVMGTFHSVFVRFLRDYAPSIGYPESFTIYDAGDSVSAIKTCLKELGLDEKTYKPKEVLARISLAKNNLVTSNAYAANKSVIETDRRGGRPELYKVFQLYERKCRQAGVMDFDDILVNMYFLLRGNPEACEAISTRFCYILVDEFQDTNYAQYLIIRRLSQVHGNICVVGDDSQSIYAFRGAKIQNILDFRSDFPSCRIFRLERNYRSTKVIVEAANSVIAKNEGRIPKNCYSVGSEGEKIRLMRSYTEKEEGIMIASSIISKMQEEGAQYQDFAILYRTNSQSRAIEEALRRRNLPYMIWSGNSFFERAEVKDMMAYFKLAVNVNDDESFIRAVGKPPRGIGDTTMKALAEAARVSGVSLFGAAYMEDLEKYGLKKGAVARLRAFCDMIGRASARVPETGARDLAVSLADESGLYLFYKGDTSIEGLSRTANIEELMSSIASFGEEWRNERREELLGESDEDDIDESLIPTPTLDRFLENVSLLTAVDSTDEEDSRNKIALMTVHSAKGLEFPYVYVAGMEENLFPSLNMLSTRENVEEERRLFYVAVTRAKKAVVLTYADTRMRNGKTGENSPSRFIREIDPKYISNPLVKASMIASSSEGNAWKGGFGRFGRGTAPTTFRPSAGQPSRPASRPVTRPAAGLSRPLPPKIPDSEFIPETMDKFRVGQIIEHNRFGRGKILDISGTIPDLKARIAFDEYGEKLLLLKYAKLRFV